MAIVASVSELEIRHARAGDAAAVAAIYNDGIEDRLATFETRARTPGEVEAWLGVAGEEVVGFARVSPYSDRCVYEGVGEHAVDVARRARGGGVGRRLLAAVCEEAERAGLYKLTSRVFTDNAASRAVHLAAGFVEVGVQRRHGRLDGRWKDCVLVERLLGEAAEGPASAAG